MRLDLINDELLDHFDSLRDLEFYIIDNDCVSLFSLERVLACNGEYDLMRFIDDDRFKTVILSILEDNRERLNG